MERRESHARIVGVLLWVMTALAGAGTAAETDSNRGEAASTAWSDLLPYAKQPLAGVLSGGQPSPRQLEAASAAGFKTVINLRLSGERDSEGEPERVEALGMVYVSIPVAGADGLTEETARRLAAALGAAERPVLLHCGSGNRIGALFALMAFHLEGKSAEEALEVGREAGLTRLEPVVRERLGLAR